MEELFLENGQLVSFDTWTSRIEALKQQTNPSTKESVQEALTHAVTQRIPKTRFGLMLSGGVDSSTLALLLKKQGADFCCYTVGIEGANDLDWSQQVAETLDLEHNFKVLSLDDIHELLCTLAPLFLTTELSEENQAVLFGVAAVELGCIKLAQADGITHFFGGLGSEEIFAGYNRHNGARDINEECWRGLVNMWKRDLVRDCTLATHTGITVSTPFLDADLIVAAMGISGEEKIKDTVKKAILRQISESLGLPPEFAWRKKQAAQYGSRIDKAIEKLAKQKGFSYKRDYLASLV